MTGNDVIKEVLAMEKHSRCNFSKSGPSFNIEQKLLSVIFISQEHAAAVRGERGQLRTSTNSPIHTLLASEMDIRAAFI